MGLRRLSLTTEQWEELLLIRDTDPKSYTSERAADLLKVTEGLSAASIAHKASSVPANRIPSVPGSTGSLG